MRTQIDFEAPWWPWDEEAERARKAVFAVARWAWTKIRGPK